MCNSPAALLHIGTHKTATTYLQMELFSKPDFGFARLWSAPNHQIWALRRFVLDHDTEFDADQMREAAQAEAARHDPSLTPVFSDERLSGHMLGDWRSAHHVGPRLQAVFPKAKVLIGVREQNAAIASSYMQYLRLNGEWTIDQFIRHPDDPRDFTPIFSIDRLKYDRLVAQYQALFGKEQVFVMPLERLIRDRAALLEDLSTFLDRDISNLPNEARNASVGMAGMQFLRYANKLSRRNPEQLDMSGRQPWVYRQKMRMAWKVSAWTSKSKQDAMKAKQARRISEQVGTYYADSNRALSKLMGVDLTQYGYRL